MIGSGEVLAVSEHAEQDANKAFGFWIYLMSDLVLFGALFATFAVLSHSYAGGPSDRGLIDLGYTFTETMLLLLSSASFGLVMLAVHAGRRRRALIMLGLTFLLGAGFIGMELHEFRAMILAGDGPGRSAFLSAWFTLVGTHGTHVFFGLLWMLVMIVQVAGKGLSPPVRSRLFRLGMFWHFLDIVWVGVFTVVYLMGSL